MPRAIPKNKPIGTCPCPITGCTETCNVFKFRARSENESRRRFAGKLYIVCPVDGRLSNQDYILQHATIPTTQDQERPAMSDDKKPAKPKPDDEKGKKEQRKPDNPGDERGAFDDPWFDDL